jgi:hypothetical protein
MVKFPPMTKIFFEDGFCAEFYSESAHHHTFPQFCQNLALNPKTPKLGYYTLPGREQIPAHPLLRVLVALLVLCHVMPPYQVPLRYPK